MASCPQPVPIPIEGWMSVNHERRFCRICHDVLSVASDENLDSVEYSIPVSKFVDAMTKSDPNNSEFGLDVLPENSPTLHFTSADESEITRWSNALADLAHDTSFSCGSDCNCKSKKIKKSLTADSSDSFSETIMKLSDFEIVRTIGKGYCGRVHLARRRRQSHTNPVSKTIKIDPSSFLISKSAGNIGKPNFHNLKIDPGCSTPSDLDNTSTSNNASNNLDCDEIGPNVSLNELTNEEDQSGKCQLVALKTINKTRLVNSTMIQRTIVERNILLQANHPFIPKLYAAFQTEHELVLALEYIGGGDLQHHLDKGEFFSPFQIKIYLAELVIALSHLHQMRIVFRDLKPSNILIAKDGNLKLTDFGLAKDLIESGHTNSLCGTHEYLAPEMIEGKLYGYAVDWWALGVIAYRLMCGVLPFHSDNLCRLYSLISKCRYRIPRTVSEDARDLITGLLQKNPNDRLQFEQIKEHKYFADIDWDKVYRKEYKLDFLPWLPDDEHAINFDVCPDEPDDCPADSNLYVDNFTFSSDEKQFEFFEDCSHFNYTNSQLFEENLA
ncbi:AGC family protein kinase [Tritrichomonas foetus]|uniref:AGC family protein kinase n=1 Tax=Tritrichomonas foetus TaxID=1144522 RepID=A0A1J4KZ16_9EUKA|nr:AGC family protein kinase [Tritrichomonas foetus]|eukprot:OHT16499.1 AGC family protein kinase [Tritrichomonas foetus]